MGIAIFIGLIASLVLLYAGQGYWAVLTSLATISIESWSSSMPLLAAVTAVTGFIFATVFGVPSIRQPLVSARLVRTLASSAPSIGTTERIALEAGTVWWDDGLFSDKPNWRRLLNFFVQSLSDEECTFLDGPVEMLCRMINDWDIKKKRDL